MPEPPQPAGQSDALLSPTYTSILEEHNVPAKQREIRKGLIQEIEELEATANKKKRKKTALVSHIALENAPGAGLDASDIPILGNILISIGDVDTLSLLLQSPGGDGTVVEKIVTLCRAQCKRLRVIIPNRAKSAATMIALGADEIVMGYASELGPIDAQIPVVVEGYPRYMSAQSFIDARDALLERYKDAAAKKEDTQPILQMIASLDVPFIEECQRLMDFGRDVVRKLLSQHMFSKDKNRDAKIDKIVEMFSSVQMHKVHGRKIDGPTARTQLGLTVKLLAKDSQLWTKVWEYYTRAEVHLGTMRSPKMFETRIEMLTAQPLQ